MDMAKPVAFKAHILPRVLDETSVLLLTEISGTILLRGALYARLAPLLDGSRSADEIVDALKPYWPAADVYFALLKLERNGHITSVASGVSREAAAFWHGLGTDVDEATRRLSKTTVSIATIGDTRTDALALSVALVN